jgi:hypothetical protein
METKMTLLEQTYKGLRQAGLIGTAEAFSTQYLGKNKNWYALQAHYGRDFSVRAAVGCVRSLELAQGGDGLDAAQRSVLRHLAQHLHQHLASHYGVAALH